VSRLGEIRVECDTPSCQGEDVFTPEHLMGWSIRQLLELGGWQLMGDGWRDHWRCPQCVEGQQRGQVAN
jgi:hypothetical protein